MKICERCLYECKEGEIYPSKYFNKLFCIPCERQYEKSFKDFRISFMNNQPERLSPEDSYFTEFGCSVPVSFKTSTGLKRMKPGKIYDENLDEIGICDSPNTANK